MHPVKGGFLQEELLSLAPVLLYSLIPLFVGFFLWNSDDNQFAFSLLPLKMRESWTIKSLAATIEFRFIHFMFAMAHLAAFHGVTFVRTVQTALTHFTKDLRQVLYDLTHFCRKHKFYTVCNLL